MLYKISILIILITFVLCILLNLNYSINLLYTNFSGLVKIVNNEKVPSVNLYKLVENKIRKDNPKKFILFWTKLWGYKNWRIDEFSHSDVFLDEKFFEEMQCPETNCILTNNRSFLANEYEYDAVLFHAAEKREVNTPTPKYRSLHQMYVMATHEPPSIFKHNFYLDDYFYNWTMTFKLNSDVILPYARARDKILNEIISPSKYPKWRFVESFKDENILHIIRNKTKMAAQFVSHCNAASKRDELTKKLQNYINVDVYGKCGSLTCKRYTKQCDDMLDEEYKFYLSFENDICEDYVTEKLFNALNRMVIPIVFGGADYNRFAPPYSYINVNDFNTVKELSEYLIYLDENPEIYLQYFWWKKYYEIKDYKFHSIAYCNLCTKLHNANIKEKVQYYGNIKKWYTDTCHRKRKIQFK